MFEAPTKSVFFLPEAGCEHQLHSPMTIQDVKCARVDQLPMLGMVISPLIGIVIMGI